MKRYLYLSLLTFLCLSSSSWVYGQTINVCLSVTKDTLALVYTPTSSYTLGSKTLWNNQLVTIRYPSSTTVSFGAPLSADPNNFRWIQDSSTPGPGADGGDGYRYVKFIMPQNFTTFDFSANKPVVVFRLKVTASTAVPFEVDNSSNWVAINNGNLAINNSVNGNLAGIVTTDCGSTTDVSCSSLQAKPGANMSLCAGTTATLSGTATGGKPGYSYAWSPATGLSSTTLANPTITLAGTTTYSLTVTDGNGCTATNTVQITSIDLPVVTATTTSPSCSATNTANTDGTITLSRFIGGTSGEHYAYTLGSTYTGTDTYSTARQIPAGGVIASNLPNPTTSQAYTVRIFNSTGCTQDLTITLQAATCGCLPVVCMPITVTKIR